MGRSVRRAAALIRLTGARAILWMFTLAWIQAKGPQSLGVPDPLVVPIASALMTAQAYVMVAPGRRSTTKKDPTDE